GRRRQCRAAPDEPGGGAGEEQRECGSKLHPYGQTARGSAYEALGDESLMQLAPRVRGRLDRSELAQGLHIGADRIELRPAVLAGGEVCGLERIGLFVDQPCESFSVQM